MRSGDFDVPDVADPRPRHRGPGREPGSQAPQQPPRTHPRSIKHRPQGASRTIPIPPQLACLLRWHMRAFGCAEDGRLFRGGRGGPLSESLYGRIWHQARAAAIPGLAGTWPARRPYDLRHAALSLWLASAPRLPKSPRVPGTACMSCSPPTPTAYLATTRSPASTSSKPSAPAAGPRLAHKNPRGRQEFRPSCVRATAGPSGTQLDLKPPARSGEIPVTCGNTGRRDQVHGLRPQTGGPRHPSRPPR